MTNGKMTDEEHTENLTASFLASSDAVYDLFCEVCAEDDKHLEAKGFCVECRDYLCQDCVQFHEKNRASRNHVVHNESQMPQQKPPPQAPLRKSTTGSTTEVCDHHSDRLVEFFCHDHQHLCCSVCMTLRHRQCLAVDCIPDLLDQLLDSHGYKRFIHALNSGKTKSQNVIKTAKGNTSLAEKLCADATLALQELQKKWTTAFGQLEDTIRKKVEEIKSDDVVKMTDIGDKGTLVLDEVEKISLDCQSLQSQNKLGDLFVQMIKLEDRVQAFHRVLDETKIDNNVTTYTFQPGAHIQGILDDPASIGQLSINDAPSTTAAAAQMMANETSPCQQPSGWPSATTVSALALSTTRTPVLAPAQASVVRLKANTSPPKYVPVKARVVRFKEKARPANYVPAKTSVVTLKPKTDTKLYRKSTPDTISSNQKMPERPAIRAKSVAVVDRSPRNVTAEQGGKSARRNSSAAGTAAVLKSSAMGSKQMKTGTGFKDVETVQLRDIRVSTEKDKSECQITGSVLLPSNKMILTDYANSKMKLVEFRRSKVTFELKTPSGPSGVAKITDDLVAITLPEDREIWFVNVTPVLKSDKEMNVGGKCTALVHSDGKLILAFCEPLKIEIMALDGRVEKKIECSHIFEWPSHMTLDLGHDAIYVSDSGGNCVKRISMDGVIEAQYKDRRLKNPRGVTVDRQGRVFVCGETSHNIHLLTPDLVKIKVLVGGIPWPRSLAINCNIGGKLYVGGEGNSLRVYRLS